MVEKNAYRVLSSYTYDQEEKSIRSERVAPNPVMSDTASDMDYSSTFDTSKSNLPFPLRSISAVPEHDEFIEMMINAKTVAQFQKAPADITWRGYSTTITPDFEISKENLMKELLSALQNLISLSATEEKVIYYLLLRLLLLIGLMSHDGNNINSFIARRRIFNVP